MLMKRKQVMKYERSPLGWMDGPHTYSVARRISTRGHDFFTVFPGYAQDIRNPTLTSCLREEHEVIKLDAEAALRHPFAR